MKLPKKIPAILMLYVSFMTGATARYNVTGTAVLPCAIQDPAKKFGTNILSPLPRNISTPASGNLCFIENMGQVTDQDRKPRKDIQYQLATGSGLNIFIGNCAIHYQFSKCDNPVTREKRSIQIGSGDEPASYTMYRMDVELVGANKNAKVVSAGIQDYCENYFTGNFDKNGAVAHSCSRIIYKDVYPNIDWVLYTGSNKLEHEFVVRQGGKVSDIKLKYDGATGLQLTKEGSLIANTPQGSITEEPPYTYQKDGTPVKSSFKLHDGILSYETGRHTGEITIDPGLVWATYYSGLGTGFYGSDVYASAVDGSGNIYLTGFVNCTSNFATTGAHQTTFAGGMYDAYLLKFNSAGDRQWCTYCGGSQSEIAYAIAADASGNVYIAGTTQSTSGISTAGAHQDTYVSGAGMAFLVKFNSLGMRQWGTSYGRTVVNTAPSSEAVSKGQPFFI